MSISDFIGVGIQSDASTGLSSLTTKQTTPAYYPPVVAENLNLDQSLIEIDETTGSRGPEGMSYGTRAVKGNIDCAVRPASLPCFLSMFMGSPTSANASGSAYTHTFDPLSASPIVEYGTIFTVNTDVDGTTDIVDCYYGMVGDELELSVRPNEYMMMNAGFVGVGLDQTQSAPTNSKDTTEKMPFNTVTVQIDDGSGWETLNCGEFSLKYSNNVKADEFPLGGFDLTRIDPGNIDCEVTFRSLEEISEHYRRALATSPEDCKLKVTATGSLITGAYYNSVVIQLDRIQYVTAPIDIDGSTPITGIDITARAAVNNSTGDIVVVTVTNTEDGTDYTTLS